MLPVGKHYCSCCHIITKRMYNVFVKKSKLVHFIPLCLKCQKETHSYAIEQKMKKARKKRWENHIKKLKDPSIRAQVRERDQGKCIRCNMTNEDHFIKTGKQLHVHRKIPGRFGGKYDLENCITLCYVCHPIVEADIYNPPKKGLDPRFHTPF